MPEIPFVDIVGSGPWGLNIYKSLSKLGVETRFVMNKSGVFPTWVPEAKRKSFNTWSYDSPALIIAANPDLNHRSILDPRFSSIPVFIEKPACTDLSVCMKKNPESLVFVDYTLSYSPFFSKVRSLLGDFEEKKTRIYRENFGPSSRQFPVLWDWGPHEVSMYSHLGLSDPSTVDCHAHSSGNGNMYELNLDSIRGAKFTSIFGNVSNVRRNYLRISTPDKLIEWDVSNSSLRFNGSDVPVQIIPENSALCLSLASFLRSASCGDSDYKSEWKTTELVTRTLCEVDRTCSR